VQWFSHLLITKAVWLFASPKFTRAHNLILKLCPWTHYLFKPWDVYLSNNSVKHNYTNKPPPVISCHKENIYICDQVKAPFSNQINYKSKSVLLLQPWQQTTKAENVIYLALFTGIKSYNKVNHSKQAD